VILALIKRPLSRKNTPPSQKKVQFFFAGTSSSNGISPFSLPAPVISKVIGADPYLAVANSGSNNVSILINTGKEIFVDINIYPKVLNLKNKGKRIISGIRLSEGYYPHDITGDSLELSIPSCSYCEVIYPTCGFPLWKRYLAFFPRQDLIDEIETMNLELPTKLDLKITGELDDGTLFEGLDTIRVINIRKKWRKDNN